MSTDPVIPAKSSPPQDDTLPGVSRRRFLTYVGAGAGAIFSGALGVGSLLQTGCATPRRVVGSWVGADGLGRWIQPPYPVPLPGSPEDTPDAERFAAFEVIDDLVLPDGFGYHKIAEWGEVFGPADQPEKQVRFGYNNDYTGLLKIDGTEDQYWLFVNHEYVAARPWLAAYEELFGEAPPEIHLEADTRVPMMSKYGIFTFDGYTFPLGSRIDVANADAMADVPEATRAKMHKLAGQVLSEMGISVLRARRLPDGRLEIVRDADDHRRITAYGRQNITGDHSRWSGPAAWLFDEAPRGTMCNCSGGTTPWGTFLTCEENYQNDTADEISPSGREIEGRPRTYGAITLKVGDFYNFDTPLPLMIKGSGHLLEKPLDCRQYGWVCEVDPATGHMTKHTGLGRFRHENVALRADAGQKLAAYMGDDRRGGHIWKFVSDDLVEDPKSPDTARLLEKGTLYVARFNEDHTGEWIPLVPDTPLRRPEPEHCFSQHVQVPSRFVGGPVKVGDTERDNPEIEVEDWMDIVANFASKPFADCTLGDLVKVDADGAESMDEATLRQHKNGILAMDAFLMANACGGTPSARPEDLEVHPDDRTVYIAFTDATDSSDGSPDGRIFPDSARENSRQYGAIYRILEGGSESADSDPASTTFKWGKFVASGEVAEQGGGFACADNMVFDPSGHLWLVTDISTSAQNFPTTRELIDSTQPGGKNFPGVFGNNAMFMLPTRGDHAAKPQLFALAPMDAELCGPTFTEDGETLILSVQHPGEVDGTRHGGAADVQTHIVHDRRNEPFEQQRTVPVGSNFPHGESGKAPRPCVVCVTRV